jgi:hypothetical protein
MAVVVGGSLVIVALTGCGSRASDAQRRQARELVRASKQFVVVERPTVLAVAARLTKSFDHCPPVVSGQVVPSERRLEPFDRTLFYRAWIEPYGVYARSVRALGLTDPGLRPASDALTQMVVYLRRFRNAHGTECGFIRAWRAVGLQRSFDVARFAGVPSLAPPPAQLSATRFALERISGRLQRLGIDAKTANQFVISADPFR